MSTEITPDGHITCQACGARCPANFAYCPACGEALEKSSTQGEVRPETLKGLLESSHETLVKAGSEAAEYAFGISCSLGLLGSAVLLALVFLAITRAWTSLAIIALIALLISLIVANFLALRSRQATYRTTYQRQIRAQIEQYIRENSLEQGEFQRLADVVLPPESPLHRFITEDDL